MESTYSADARVPSEDAYYLFVHLTYLRTLVAWGSKSAISGDLALPFTLLTPQSTIQIIRGHKKRQCLL